MIRARVQRLLAVIGALSFVFVLLSLAVAAGALRPLDVGVSRTLAADWIPALHVLLQGVALLGGIEATSLVALGIFLFLWRRGYRLGALSVGAFFGAVVIELAYKKLLRHPGPPLAISHPDGPSLSDLADSSLQLQASFPSGHMTRTVIVYGLLAFIVHRLAPAGFWRRVAVPAAIALIVLMAFDRVYLEVHWASDVVGGLVLGCLGLAVAITWLEFRGGTAIE